MRTLSILHQCLRGSSLGFILVASIATAQVEPAVSVSTSTLRAQGLSALNAGDTAAAIEAADAIIRQNGADSRAVRLAADLYLRAGEVDFAAQMFDRYIEMEPQQMPQLWQRGIALCLSGKYRPAMQQFDAHRRVNPNDVENAAWHFLATAKSHSAEEAKNRLLEAPNDSRAPMAEIWQMLQTGNIDPVNERVNSLPVGSPEREEAAFYADLYLGLYADAMGQTLKARQYLARAAEDAPRHYMGDVARVYAKQLADRK